MRDRMADVWSLTRRNLIHISREPMQLSDVTIQPVLFTLLFIYVFGSGIPIPGGSYKDFALAGLLMLNLTTSVMGTAVGLSTDLHEGVIDRFRTLPMWRSAVLVGRSMADLLTAVLVRHHRGHGRPGRRMAARRTSIPSVIGGFGIALLFSYSMSWVAACVGLNSKGPESAASFGFIVLFPLAFISNAMVPTQHMPGWLQAMADWNPVSAVTAGGPAHVRQSRTRRQSVTPGPCNTRWRRALIWCAGHSGRRLRRWRPTLPPAHHRVSTGASGRRGDRCR